MSYNSRVIWRIWCPNLPNKSIYTLPFRKRIQIDHFYDYCTTEKDPKVPLICINSNFPFFYAFIS